MKTLITSFETVILQGAGTSTQKGIVYAAFAIVGIACIVLFGHNLR